MARVAVRRSAVLHGVIVYAGDSITKDSSGQPKWPEIIAAALGVAGVTHINVAVGGIALSQIASQATTLVDVYLVDGQNVRINPVFAGTNDLTGETPALEVYNRTVDYCAARKLAGWDKLVVFTILPRNNGGVNFEEKRQSFNTMLREGYTAFADGLADAAANTTIGDDGDNLNTTYYVDGVHPTAAGQAIIATIVQQVIEALL